MKTSGRSVCLNFKPRWLYYLRCNLHLIRSRQAALLSSFFFFLLTLRPQLESIKSEADKDASAATLWLRTHITTCIIKGSVLLWIKFISIHRQVVLKLFPHQGLLNGHELDHRPH